MIEKHIRIFEKGLWKYDYVLDNYMDRFSQIKKYEYNAQNQIVDTKTVTQNVATSFTNLSAGTYT